MLKTKFSPKPFVFLWHYLKLYPRDIMLSAVGVVISALAILSLGFEFRELIDLQTTLNTSPWPIMGLLFISVVLAGSAFMRTYITARLADKVVGQMKEDLFDHSLRFTQQVYESNRLGDFLARLSTDLENLRNFLSGSTAVALRSVIQFLGGSILLLSVSPRMTAYVFMIIPLVIIPIFFLGKKVRLLTKATQDQEGLVQGLIEEHLSSMVMVKAFNAQKSALDKLHVQNAIRGRNARERSRYRSIMISLIIGLIFSAMTMVLWLGLKHVHSGTLSPGQLISFLFYAVLVAGSMNSLAEVISEGATALGSMNRVMDIYTFPKETEQAHDPVPVDPDRPLSIEFSDVNFTYPGHHTQALYHANFDIPAGKVVALVGPSGAGKSTIFKLLLRFFNPNNGIISIDGKPITHFTLEQLRSLFALVPQDPTMFHGSLLDNLQFGNPLSDEDDVMRAAQAAYVDEFAAKLPEGYDTIIGEKGVRLSGGQKQRVALARALLKDAPIFLLDEATNSLDSVSEDLVQKALHNRLAHKTALIIAHRLSTVQNAHKILVIDNGQVVAEGTHSELLGKNKLYRDLAEKQFLGNHG